MLQGLVIRQAIMVIDGVLVIGVVLMALLIGINYSTGIADSSAAVAEGTTAAGMASDLVAQVRSRSEYDIIVGNKLFGPAGQMAKDTAAAPPPAEPVQETQLKLRLCGTAATSPRDMFAAAIIQNDDIGSIGTYAVGQEVVLDVVVEEVHPRKVILYNKTANRREVLRADGDKGEDEALAQNAATPGAPNTPAPFAASSPSPAPPSGPTSDIKVNKAELFRNLNFDSLRDMSVTFQYDANGNADGVASSKWESHPLGAKLGLKNGDVIKTINGEPINEGNGLPKLVTKFRNAKTIRLGIMRGGQQSVLTYTLE